LIGVRLIQLAD